MHRGRGRSRAVRRHRRPPSRDRGRPHDARAGPCRPGGGRRRDPPRQDPRGRDHTLRLDGRRSRRRGSGCPRLRARAGRGSMSVRASGRVGLGDTGQIPSLSAFVGYFLRLGTLGFGGPIALTGAMQRDLVERRRWVSREDYLEGLALAQLAPGPLAAQLAIYLGWVRGRVLGATAVAIAFILPSFLMVLALSAFYLRFGGLPWMLRAFYGIAPAAIAVIARSATKLLRMTLARDRLLWIVFLVNAIVTAWAGAE